MKGARLLQGEGPALDYVVSLNLHRRHLTDQQRAFVAAEDKSRKTQKVGNFSKNAINSQRFELSRICDNSNPGVKEVTKQVAEQFEVSSKAVEQAQVILNKGTPELITAAKANGINMSKAATIAKLSHDEQDKELKVIFGPGLSPAEQAAELDAIFGPEPELKPKVQTQVTGQPAENTINSQEKELLQNCNNSFVPAKEATAQALPQPLDNVARYKGTARKVGSCIKGHNRREPRRAEYPEAHRG